MVTLLQRHFQRWQTCRRCPLCEGRKHVVLCRGSVPCDVLFIGEAPGESEDVLGRPFIGPAGKLLDQIIERSLPKDCRYAITNLVACIPRDDDGAKVAEPPDESIEACAPRLQEFVRLCEPQLIVCVGNLARDWIDPKTKNPITFHEDIRMVDITHPAAILRANIAMRGLAVRKCIVTVENAFKKYVIPF